MKSYLTYLVKQSTSLRTESIPLKCIVRLPKGFLQGKNHRTVLVVVRQEWRSLHGAVV